MAGTESLAETEELEKITNVLDEYQSNKLFSLDLRRDLIGQEAAFDTSQEIDDNDDLPENVKLMEVDGKLLSTLDYDLISYEVREGYIFSINHFRNLLRQLLLLRAWLLILRFYPQSYLAAVQFNWVEAAAKEKFIVSTILEEDGLKCSYDDIQRLSKLVM